MKPGLGGRRCQQCGSKVEGAGSKLLRDCPSCGAPLDAPRFTPAGGSPQFPAPQQAKSFSVVPWIAVALLCVIVGIGVAVLVEVRSRQEASPIAAIDAGVEPPSAPRIVGGTKPFDRVSATQQLTDASETVDDCKTQGAAGAGPVVTSIVIQANGKVSEVTFARAGFSDTAQGKCVAERFSKIRVPPFAGGPEKLSKAVAL
ncbi:MAG: hypothetical protein ABIP89_00400 [Polyangiaceae bacterium]